MSGPARTQAERFLDRLRRTHPRPDLLTELRRASKEKDGPELGYVAGSESVRFPDGSGFVVPIGSRHEDAFPVDRVEFDAEGGS